MVDQSGGGMTRSGQRRQLYKRMVRGLWGEYNCVVRLSI